MAKNITSLAMAKSNIDGFEAFLEESDDLQSRLGYVRAWYATPNKDGDWQFGPSKFIGYQGLDAQSYVENTYSLDGKVTERLLQQWFVEIDEAHPLFDELHEALVDFLDWYDKRPSSAFRLNIPIELAKEAAGTAASEDKELADMLIAVAQRLPQLQRRRIAAAI